MQTLNGKATAILDTLVEMIKEHGQVKIDRSNGLFLPVTVQEIFYTDSYKIYSVSHSRIQEGILFCFPEMNFIKNIKEGTYITSYFRQDGHIGYLGREQESAFLVGDEIQINDIKLHADHTRIGTIFLLMIKQQQKI